MRDRPFVLSTHGTLRSDSRDPQNKTGAFSRRLYDLLTLKTAVKRADAVVVASQVEYEEALEFGVHKDKLHVIPNGIEVPSQTANRSSRAGSPLHLLFAGPLTRQRRLELLLRAARKLTLPFEVTVLATNDIQEGDDSAAYLAELKKLSQSLGIQDRVHLKPHSSPEDRQQAYAQADLFVYPSSYETSGNTLLEAGASGLPLIATPVGLANEVVASGETGFIVPADPDTICDRILQLSDPATRLQFGHASREKVLHHCGWGRVIEQTLNVYRSLLEKN